MPYPVSKLIEGRGKPTTVAMDERVQAAIDLMSEYDYSQLPVIDKAGQPVGMVTHETILSALTNFHLGPGQLFVHDAMVGIGRTQSYRAEDDLFDLLDRLRDANAVLIVDNDDRLIGIVTSYDANEYFRRRAEDIMLVEDIENTVKDLVLAAFTTADGKTDEARLAAAIAEVTQNAKELRGRYGNAVRNYLSRLPDRLEPDRQWLDETFGLLMPKREPRKFEDLTLHEYADLLLHRDRQALYRALFSEIAPDALRALLNGVRETRNVLAHFKREITAGERRQLQFCAQWFANHPLHKPAETAGAPTGAPAADEGETPAGAASEVEEIEPTEEALSPNESRYGLLAMWLQNRPPDVDSVALTFTEIEVILGQPLPPSARKHRSWWANDSVGHVQSRQWLEVGWRQNDINIREEKVVFKRVQDREKAYIDFFTHLLADCRAAASFPVGDPSPRGQNWMVISGLPPAGRRLATLGFSFAYDGRFRVELYIDTGEKERNKRVFDDINEHRGQIEDSIGQSLDWERIEDKRACRITLSRSGRITDSPDALAALRRWGVDGMARFHRYLSALATEALQK